MIGFKFEEAVKAVQKGGATREEAESLIVDATCEMIEATDDAVGYPEPVVLSEHEHDLAMEIIGGLVRGGLDRGHAILLIALYAVAVETRALQN
ncbi:MAG: hypothetical protein IKE28_02315 [Solobacterium sp.]|nr:hypothetical protein [Solobacterium sp.]